MKKIKNFFWSCLGFFFLSAALCGILDITFKQLVLYCAVGIVVLFCITLAFHSLKDRSLRAKDSAQNDLDKISITVDNAAHQPAISTSSSFSSSIEKEDYDYAYSHVGLFRPEGTPGPMPKIGTEVFFREEPDNPYDAKAVKAVWYCNGEERLVGYFYRSDSTIREMARDWITRGDNYYSAITDTYDKPRLFIGFNK